MPKEDFPKTITVSENDFMRYISMRTDDPELLSWMKKNGIKFDQGLVTLIVVDAGGKRKRVKLETSKTNFGYIDSNVAI